MLQQLARRCVRLRPGVLPRRSRHVRRWGGVGRAGVVSGATPHTCAVLQPSQSHRAFSFSAGSGDVSVVGAEHAPMRVIERAVRASHAAPRVKSADVRVVVELTRALRRAHQFARSASAISPHLSLHDAVSLSDWIVAVHQRYPTKLGQKDAALAVLLLVRRCGVGVHRAGHTGRSSPFSKLCAQADFLGASPSAVVRAAASRLEALLNDVHTLPARPMSAEVLATVPVLVERALRLTVPLRHPVHTCSLGATLPDVPGMDPAARALLVARMALHHAGWVWCDTRLWEAARVPLRDCCSLAIHLARVGVDIPNAAWLVARAPTQAQWDALPAATVRWTLKALTSMAPAVLLVMSAWSLLQLGVAHADLLVAATSPAIVGRAVDGDSRLAHTLMLMDAYVHLAWRAGALDQGGAWDAEAEALTHDGHLLDQRTRDALHSAQASRAPSGAHAASHVTAVSLPQRRVIQALSQLGVEFAVEHEVAPGISVDLCVPATTAPAEGAGGTRTRGVVLEVHGPRHYHSPGPLATGSDNNRLNAATVSRARHVESLGWTVVHMPARELDACTSGDALVSLVVRKLRAGGVEVSNVPPRKKQAEKKKSLARAKAAASKDTRRRAWNRALSGSKSA